ncbi:MAG: Crp/Fnr family transcriptional regulator [Alphaproteobacteria bacterium]|nr:Crp/Fnr family transcriptional regulator [Alphaproteobacteria bacterium]
MQIQDSQTLDGIAILATVSRADRDQLARQCKWRRHAGGEQIIDSQSETRDVFFVVGGLVRVVNYSMSGREVTLDDIGPGGYFGELAAIDGEPRSASVMAREETLTAALSPEGFATLIERHPVVGVAIMRGLARIIRQSTDRIMDLSTLGANNRVHAELLRQARACSTDERTAEIRPIPVHSDIASRVSTTRETVARVLNELARDGVVRRAKDALVVLDMEKLERLVEEVRGI